MIQERNQRRNAGFTIVELMIAMAFISLLLLAIAGAVMQIGAIYNKGLTMKSVNQSGRIIVADMKRTIGESQPFTLPAADSALYGHVSPFVLQSGTGVINSGEAVAHGGRLCTGTYSYVWNIGTEIKSEDPNTWRNKYSGDDSDIRQIRLVKVRDNGGQYCMGDTTGAIDATKSTELLSEGNLAIQKFHIERLTTNVASGMALYSIGITISNADTEAINTVDNSCKPPSEVAVLQNFCSVNEFIFTTRTGNKGAQ
ncbi:MAG: hypothetical protein JWN75_1005 [Candidatus Saccharibacteria bacterium]|nr:hypothetical protein [Candidatus Saccharibacteria bacterium]